MSTGPSVTRGTFCLRCSAVGDPEATSCWMCGSNDLRTLGPTVPVALPATPVEKDAVAWYIGDESHRTRSHAMPPYVKPAVTLIGVMLAAAFLLGLWKESPGLAIVLMVILGVGIQAATGRTTTSSDSGTRAAGSVLRVFGGVVGVILRIILIFVVVVVALCVFAFICCSKMLWGE